VKLAFDAPCVDACVDYRAIVEEPDAGWLRQVALSNLKKRMTADEYKHARQSSSYDMIVDDEMAQARGDMVKMWEELGTVGGKTPDEISDIRQQIVARVQMRKQYLTWVTYRAALARSTKDQAWYRRLLAADVSDIDAIDNYEVEVAEETQPHVILNNLPPEAQARLARHEEWSFCLALRPGKFRSYPQGDAACHVLGYLSPVKPDEQTLKDDPSGLDADATKNLRGYRAEDLIGRAGLEALCEQTLRGSRGFIDRSIDDGQVLNRIDPAPGGSVRSTIDIELEKDVEKEFVKKRVHVDPKSNLSETRYNQHGAAVVIEVKTGEVLAMVSYPGYDINTLQANYSMLAVNDLDRPLQDRATQMAVEPGSTVKPIVGAGAITHGFYSADDKFLCNGTLVIDGRRITDSHHCWIAAFKSSDPNVLPTHKGVTEDPTLSDDGKLSISDGIKHSCNVVFETIANKMKMSELSFWFDRFGLGRPTGIGIEESPGRLYRPSDSRHNQLGPLTWSAGIGEQVVHATVLQMANVAATFARGGIWKRPRLISETDELESAAQPAGLDGPDTVDLGLSPAALNAVKTGMIGVCTDYGSGNYILPRNIERGLDDPPLEDDPLLNMQLAGKTGSAQTGQLLKIYERDSDGKVKVDDKGEPVLREVQFGEPNTDGWYVAPKVPDPEKHVAHAWMMVYAPADHPQVAVCVLVEYGEAGGRVAGVIAHDILVDCVKHKYLSSGN
jgi:penicillin-binding protein 2